MELVQYEGKSKRLIRQNATDVDDNKTVRNNDVECQSKDNIAVRRAEAKVQRTHFSADP